MEEAQFGARCDSSCCLGSLTRARPSDEENLLVFGRFLGIITVFRILDLNLESICVFALIIQCKSASKAIYVRADTMLAGFFSLRINVVLVPCRAFRQNEGHVRVVIE